MSSCNLSKLLSTVVWHNFLGLSSVFLHNDNLYKCHSLTKSSIIHISCFSCIAGATTKLLLTLFATNAGAGATALGIIDCGL